jgi:hypothetical protein
MSFKKFAAAESAVIKAAPVEPSKTKTVVGPTENQAEPADKTSTTDIPSDKP